MLKLRYCKHIFLVLFTHLVNFLLHLNAFTLSSVKLLIRSVKLMLKTFTDLSESGNLSPERFIFLFDLDFYDSDRLGESFNLLLALVIFCLKHKYFLFEFVD